MLGDYSTPMRFLGVGILNTVFGYSCYAALLFVGLNHSVALLCSHVAGVLFNYKSNGLLVFGSTGNGRLLQFAAVYGGLFLLNLACLNGLTALGTNRYLAGALIVPPSAVLSYWLNKVLVFRRPR